MQMLPAVCVCGKLESKSPFSNKCRMIFILSTNSDDCAIALLCSVLSRRNKIISLISIDDSLPLRIRQSSFSEIDLN